MLKEELELTRHDVTPAQFLSYVRYQIRKHHFTSICPEDINLEYWKRGGEIEFDYWDTDGTHPAKGERSVSKPYEMQTYVRQYNGDTYNLIMEFDFWDNKIGHGYFYFLNVNYDTETTKTEETTNTEEKKEEETMSTINSNNHYYEELTKDIKAYIEWNINPADFSDREELEEKLNDDLWVEDSVTGNASGSYTFNREAAKKNVLRATDLVEEMAQEFGISAEDIGNHFLNNDWEWFDVSIRCYLLGQMICKVLDEMEEAGKLTFAK